MLSKGSNSGLPIGHSEPGIRRRGPLFGKILQRDFSRWKLSKACTNQRHTPTDRLDFLLRPPHREEIETMSFVTRRALSTLIPPKVRLPDHRPSA